MNIEIERKFLVTSTAYKQLSTEKIEIIQGYLSKIPERTVRIRIADKNAWLTLKGKSDSQGLARREWEYKIPLSEAHELLALCEKPLIRKTRYKIPHNNLMIEVDEFQEPRQTVWAEVELPSMDTLFDPPEWLGKEVTGNPNYYNAQL